MNEPGQALLAALRYAVRHPRGLVICAARATLLRITVPLSALRYAFAHQTSPKAPRDVLLEAHPPGVRIAMTLDTAACPVRVDGTVKIDEVRAGEQELRISGQVSDIRIGLAGEDDGTLLGRLKSAGLGVANLGTWLNVVPIGPKMIVSSEGDRVELDLMRDDSFARSEFARKWLPLIAPMIEVRELVAVADAVEIRLRLRPGFAASWRALRKAAPEPVALQTS